MGGWHLAQVNVAYALGDADDPVMAEFNAQLDAINALADRSPGFVWRYVTDSRDPMQRELKDPRVLFNMSVWESVEALKDYTYRTMHAELLRDRKSWFEKFEGSYLALWWVPEGHTPSVDEAKQRLAHLEEHGPSQFAFTFKTVMPPDESFLAKLDWSIFAPCPATS